MECSRFTVTVTLILVATMLFALSSADVYFGGLTINAAPIWLGSLPFIQYGNITGRLSMFGNDTSATGNIVLCAGNVGGPLEPTLEFCAQYQPAGIIWIFSPVSATVPEQYLGRDMYTDITMPCQNVPDYMRHIPIIEINFEDITLLLPALGSNMTVTMDGSTRNWWEWMYEGPLGVIYQVFDSVVPGITTIVWIALAVRWYRAQALFQVSIKTFMMLCALIACPMRCLYNAIDPTGVRRMLIAANDFILNTLELMFGVMSFTAYAIVQLQSVFRDDFKVKTFLDKPWAIISLIAATIGWVLYLVVIRILYGFPEVSPMGTGYASLAIIIIQDILLGACAITYTFASIVLIKRISQLQGSKLLLVKVLLVLGSSALFIWFLFIVTAIAMTGYWQQPLVPGVTQILCSLFQTVLELLQAVSIWQSETQGTGPVGKRRTASRSYGKTVLSSKSQATTSSSADIESAVQSKPDDSSNDDEELQVVVKKRADGVR